MIYISKKIVLTMLLAIAMALPTVRLLAQSTVTYSKNTWSNLNDFNVNTAGATIVSGKIQLATGSPSFAQSLELKDTSNVAHWKFTVRLKMTSTTAGNYGPSVGLKGTNGYQPTSTILFPNFNTSDGNQGRMEHFVQGWSWGWASRWFISTSKKVTIATNNVVLLTVERTLNQMNFSVKNLTTNVSADTIFTMANHTDIGEMPAGSGKFTINHHGGTLLIDSIAVEKDEPTTASFALLGDNKSMGWAASSASVTYENRLRALYPRMILSAGFYNATVHVLNSLNEIIALKPQYALLAIGANDIRAGVADATWKARYQLIVTTLEANGIQCLHLLPFQEPLSLTAQKNWIVSTYPGKYIDTWTATSGGGNLAADNIALSDSGHARVFRTVRDSLAKKLNLLPNGFASPGMEMLELVKLATTARQAKDLTCNVSYSYADDASPGTVLETMSGVYKFQDGKYRLQLGDGEYIQGNQYQLTVFHDDSSIVINNKSAMTRLFPMPLLDTNFSKFNIDSIQVSALNGISNAMKIYFNANSYYAAFDMEYNTEDYRITKIVYKVRENTGPPDDSPSGMARITLLFSNYSTTGIDPSVFDEDAFIYQSGGVFLKRTAYTDYDLFIHVGN